MQNGLHPGDRIVISPVDFAIDGMKVRVRENIPIERDLTASELIKFSKIPFEVKNRQL